MESRVTVHATLEEMERLFDDTKGGFLVKYYERTEQHQNYDTFKVIVRHGEDIGRQDGEVFGYQSFMDKFDNLESRFLKSDDKIFLDRDVDIAQQGLEGGLSEKTVAKVLKIYGSYQCKDSKYVQALMKSDKIRSILQELKQKENSAAMSR